MSSSETAASPRSLLRQQLLAERDRLRAADTIGAAQEAVTAALRSLLAQLEPGLLGGYWPVRSEFNPWVSSANDRHAPRALPFSRRTPHEMVFRAWDGTVPTLKDDNGIPCSDGAVVVPDVVLVPCVGFTAAGHRLGYGGGYFDRWLAAHPGVTAIGLAWSQTRLTVGEFAPGPHDQPLTLVVTEQGVV